MEPGILMQNPQVWVVAGLIAMELITVRSGDIVFAPQSYEAGLTSTRIFSLLPGSNGVRVEYFRPW